MIPGRISRLAALLFWAALGLGCQSAFAPPLAEHRVDGDGDSDADVQAYTVKVLPQYAYQGTTFTDGSLTFPSATDLAALRQKLAVGDPSRQSYEIDYGPGVHFLLVRFDPDTLSFRDLRGVVSATARTGEHTVRVRISYGEVSVVEYGRFYVLPPQDTGNKQTLLGVR